MAFVVQTGEDVTMGANSYITVAFLDEHFGDRGYALPSDDVDKQFAIVKSSQYADVRFGRKLRGVRSSGDQSLEFPRESLYDLRGNLVKGTPVRWQQAIAEYANLLLNDSEVVELGTLNNSVIQEKVEVIGPITEKTVYESGRGQKGATYPAIDGLIYEYIRSGGSVIRG